MENLKWELEKVQKKSEDGVSNVESALVKQKKYFEEKLRVGLEEKGREIEKVNEELLELLNKELNNEINNVVVPYVDERLMEQKEEASN